MSEIDEEQRRQITDEFGEATNMTATELEEWLETDESQSVGDADDAESTGHASGRRIVELKRKKRVDYDDDDYEHMRKVAGYIRRHLAQRPSGDVSETSWRHSLMNWGHDPCGTDPTRSPVVKQSARAAPR